MSITYHWKITGLIKTNTDGLQDVVVGTRWEKTGVDDLGNSGTFSGATPFDAAQIDPSNFISYNSLNEEIVLDWIKSVVVGEYEKHVNEQIQKQIDSKKIVTVETKDFPWIPARS